MSKIETVKLLARQTAEREKIMTEETNQFRQRVVWETETIRKGIDTTHSYQKAIMNFLNEQLPPTDNSREIIKELGALLMTIQKEQKQTQWIWVINFLALVIPTVVLAVSLVIYYLIHQ